MGKRLAHLLLAPVVGLVAMPLSGAAGGRAGRPAAVVIERVPKPSLDQPAPFLWDAEAGQPVGAEANRFELDDARLAPDLSAWYHLAYVPGGDRLLVYEHNPVTARGADSAIARSENLAWRVATGLVHTGPGSGATDTIPDWARPRTGNSEGSSAGLIFGLANLDILTPGPLAGAVRVAGTGAIGADGVVTAVRMVDAKLAAARLAGVDVFFTPEIQTDAATHVVSHAGPPTPERTIGDWLNTAAYERAGRAASLRPGALAMVEIDDIRQAVAWLCGRTARSETCALAHRAANAPLRAARPYGVGITPGRTRDNTFA